MYVFPSSQRERERERERERARFPGGSCALRVPGDGTARASRISGIKEKGQKEKEKNVSGTRHPAYMIRPLWYSTFIDHCCLISMSFRICEALYLFKDLIRTLIDRHCTYHLLRVIFSIQRLIQICFLLSFFTLSFPSILHKMIKFKIFYRKERETHPS